MLAPSTKSIVERQRLPLEAVQRMREGGPSRLVPPTTAGYRLAPCSAESGQASPSGAVTITSAATMHAPDGAPAHRTSSGSAETIELTNGGQSRCAECRLRECLGGRWRRGARGRNLDRAVGQGLAGSLVALAADSWSKHFVQWAYARPPVRSARRGR
jgi:hypothetical protein